MSNLLEALREASAKATKGEWHIRTLENFGWNIVGYEDGDKFRIDRIAKTKEEANARLIALLCSESARNEIIAALEELERLREALTLAANRLGRCSVEFIADDNRSTLRWDCPTWEQEARAALTGSSET